MSKITDFVPQVKNPNRHTVYGERLLGKSIQTDGWLERKRRQRMARLLLVLHALNWRGKMSAAKKGKPPHNKGKRNSIKKDGAKPQ